MFSAITFNMQNGEPWLGPEAAAAEPDIARTVEFLREQSEDIIFLQEVERGHEGGLQVEPPPHYTMLKEGLAGYYSVFGYPLRNPEEIPFGLGLAIFSRFELTNFWRMDLPAAEVNFEFGGRVRRPSERLVLGARANVGGRTLELINTHLQAFFMIDSSSDRHRGQRDQLESKLGEMPAATLLGGDFNCSPEESTLEQFEAAGFSPVQSEKPTWKRRPYVLDHLLAGRGLRVLGCEVVPTECSDHHAVRAEFEFAG